MIDRVPFCNQDECCLLPLIAVGAMMCDSCETVHSYYATVQFLFWGLTVVWPFDGPEVEL